MKKVLIVDDSHTIRIQLRDAFKAASNCIVLEAASGEEGLEMAISNPDLSLIISDLNMGAMDGLEMVSRIKQVPELKDIPVIMLTTESGDDEQARGAEIGLKTWIVKPVSSAKVVAAITKKFLT